MKNNSHSASFVTPKVARCFLLLNIIWSLVLISSVLVEGMHSISNDFPIFNIPIREFLSPLLVLNPIIPARKGTIETSEYLTLEADFYC